MYAGVVHTILDPQAWGQILADWDPSQLPEGFQLLATGTSAQSDRTLCLWQVPSVEALQTALDQIAAGSARNDCFALAEGAAC